MFTGTVDQEFRSLMNIPFVTGDKDLDAKVVAATKAAGYDNLKGPQERWRPAGFHLQRHAQGGRGSIGGVLEEVRGGKPVNWYGSLAGTVRPVPVEGSPSCRRDGGQEKYLGDDTS